VNKTFCVLPWTHFFHTPSGELSPCCSADDQIEESKSLGNIKDYKNYSEIINHPWFNDLRLKMLRGEKSDACKFCYQTEDHGAQSFRTSKNEMLDQMISMDEIHNMTKSDGSLKNFKMRYWDVRFSNVCNLSCRMCSPEYSHTLAKEEEIMFNGSYVKKAHDTNDFESIVEKYGPLDELYDVYFAGGEVLFQPEHWQMLEHLIDIGKTDIMLMYNTNLTKLDYNNYKLLDYISKFKDVTFTVSLDGTGKLLEYIRWGSNWNTIVENLNQIKTLPNSHLRFNHVTMFYNVLALPETLDFLCGQEYLTDPNQIDIVLANEPENHVGALPEDLKLVAVEQIKSSRYYPMLQDKLDAVCNAMMTYDYPLPTYRIATMDRRRGCDIVDVMPEIEPYL